MLACAGGWPSTFRERDVTMDHFRHTPIRYRTILVTAGVLATLFLFQAYMHYFTYRDLKDLEAFNWWRQAPVPYLNFFFWALLCPMVYRILRRCPFSGRPVPRVIAMHLGFALLIAALHELSTSVIYYAILQGIGEVDLREEVYLTWARRSLVPGTFARFMEYGVLMGVLVALENARSRRAEQEQLLGLRHELQTTQLDALRKQLQPHFLFNTLNTVNALVGRNAAAARTMLGRLGRLLRAGLDGSVQDMTTLRQELDHVGDYLGIEEVRFRDRLRVSIEVPGELGGTVVPAMILQPLVENAIKHGADTTMEGVHIRVSAGRSGDRVRIVVEDDGRGCADIGVAMSGGGIGLRNVRERVRLLYGDAGSFTVGSPAGRGFKACLILPAESPGKAMRGHEDINTAWTS